MKINQNLHACNLQSKWLWGGLNSRSQPYESCALPLSYIAITQTHLSFFKLVGNVYSPKLTKNMMPANQIENELHKYKKIERAIFFADIVLSLIIIFFARTIIKTKFGQASLWFAITLLGIIIILKTFKMLGPKS